MPRPQSDRDELGNPIAAAATRTGFLPRATCWRREATPRKSSRTSHRAVFGEELQSFTTPGYLDGRVFALYAGIPALVYGPVSEAIHGYDERVEIESVRRVTKSIALFIAEWCGVAEQAAACSRQAELAGSASAGGAATA